MNTNSIFERLLPVDDPGISLDYTVITGQKESSWENEKLNVV